MSPPQRIIDSTPTSALLKAKVDALLSGRHSTEKVLRCWGMGAGAGAQETKEAIQNLLTEYSSSFDMEEASRYELKKASPHTHGMAFAAALPSPFLLPLNH